MCRAKGGGEEGKKKRGGEGQKGIEGKGRKREGWKGRGRKGGEGRTAIPILTVCQSSPHLKLHGENVLNRQ